MDDSDEALERRKRWHEAESRREAWWVGIKLTFALLLLAGLALLNVAAYIKAEQLRQPPTHKGAKQ